MYSHKLLLGEKEEQEVVVWPVWVFLGDALCPLESHMAQRQSLSFATHGARSSGLKGMVRERQAL